MNFILMLTYNDMTIPDAHEVYDVIKDTGVEFIGFKDIGLPFEDLKSLTKKIQADGHKAVLEIVSLTEEDTKRSIKAAFDLGVDYVIGGTTVEEELVNSNIKYFPYIGRVIDHPAKLRGTIEEIAAQAKEIENMGVDGINLLAYRYDGDVERLVKEVVNAVNIPVICAGSIERIEQIKLLDSLKVWGFTIGGAVINKKVVEGRGLVEQMEAVLSV